jgi:predicted nucleotidyltransferase
MVGQSDQLAKSLAEAALSEVEKRVLTRLVARLRDRLGDQLLAVWLYGSRARGEADPNETHYDRRSDIDLMLIVDPGSGWGPFDGEVIPLLEEVADIEGDSPVYYSVLAYELDRLRDRRQIRSFFIQEVDRDKLILHGSALE